MICWCTVEKNNSFSTQWLNIRTNVHTCIILKLKKYIVFHFLQKVKYKKYIPRYLGQFQLSKPLKLVMPLHNWEELAHNTTTSQIHILFSLPSNRCLSREYFYLSFQVFLKLFFLHQLYATERLFIDSLKLLSICNF